MASDQAKIRLKLDTKQAKGDLRDLTKRAKATGARVGSGVRGAVGKGLGVIGLGGGVGAGLAAVKGATSSGLGDVIGEAFGGIGARMAQTVFGDMDEKARADKSAREETISVFQARAGQLGYIPPEAKSFYNQVRTINLQAERGRELFQQSDQFRSTNAGDMVDRIMTGVGELISQAVDALADKLNPFK